MKDLDYQLAGYKATRILQTINKRIEKLIDKDHAIGHSYFMLKDHENPEKGQCPQESFVIERQMKKYTFDIETCQMETWHHFPSAPRDNGYECHCSFAWKSNALDAEIGVVFSNEKLFVHLREDHEKYITRVRMLVTRKLDYLAISGWEDKEK